MLRLLREKKMSILQVTKMVRSLKNAALARLQKVSSILKLKKKKLSILQRLLYGIDKPFKHKCTVGLFSDNGFCGKFNQKRDYDICFGIKSPCKIPLKNIRTLSDYNCNYVFNYLNAHTMTLENFSIDNLFNYNDKDNNVFMEFNNKEIIPVFFQTVIDSAMCNSMYNENFIRLNILEQATANCEKLNNNLQTKYNSEYQNEITNSLLNK